MVGTLPIKAEATSPSQIASSEPIVLFVTVEQFWAVQDPVPCK